MLERQIDNPTIKKLRSFQVMVRLYYFMKGFFLGERLSIEKVTFNLDLSLPYKFFVRMHNSEE